MKRDDSEERVTTKDAKPKRTRASKSTTSAKKPASAPAEEPPASAEAGTSEPLSGEPPAADQSGVTGYAPLEPPAVPLTDESRAAAVADLTRLIVFRMEGQRYALPIEAVQEIQQMVAVSEMPGSAGAVLGVINLRGQVIPAIAMRSLVGLSDREPGLDTPMVLTYTAHGLVALIVDEVEDVVEIDPVSVQAPSAVHPLASRLLGVCRLDDGLVFLFDVDALVPAETVAGVRPR